MSQHCGLPQSFYFTHDIQHTFAGQLAPGQLAPGQLAPRLSNLSADLLITLCVIIDHAHCQTEIMHQA